MEDRVLSYGDVLLRQQDLELLSGPYWLNDQVIAFFFEYLARELFKQPGLLLVPAESTFLLANLGAGGAAAVLEPLGFPRCQLALFAVNDNPDVSCAAGGSHWSLLAYCAADGTFRHYDSSTGSNSTAAARVYAAATGVLRAPTQRLVEMSSPQQRNGYDCGMYVLAIARLLCQRYSHVRAVQHMRWEVSHTEVTPASASAIRKELLELIHSRAGASSPG